MPGLDSLREAVRRFLRSSGSYEKAVDAFIKDIQRALISSDVNVRLVFELSKKIRERALKERPPPGAGRREWLVKIVYEELSNLFGGDKAPQVMPPYKPYTIMLVGVQGSGKTTTAAKLAYYYKKRGLRVGLVAADTYRPGAYHQLRQLAEQVGASFYGDPSSKDPVDIARRGLEDLRGRADVIIIDTAGRHGYGSEEALLREMREIAEAVKPDEVMLVIDAAMGQKAYDLAKRFHESTPIGSIIVIKLDGTAKGGGALSAVAATGAPIKFIGTGEKIDELEPFKPRSFVGRLLGMGDLEALLERLEALEHTEELQKTMEEMLAGKMNMRTIYQQIQQISKLGPLRKVLQMIPGLGLSLPTDDERLKITEEKMRRWTHIIESMTYEELDKPEIIDRSRIRRIAIGSGTTPEEVRELVEYYKTMKKTLRQLKRRKGLLAKLQKQLGLPE
jgi:signal recognition particle subunit SRP54